MSELKKDLLNAIDEHLPKMTSQSLKKRLEKIDYLEKENIELSQEVKRLVVENGKIKDEYGKLKEKEHHINLTAKETKALSESIEERQKKFYTELAEMRLACEQEKANLTLNMFNTVFANNAIKTSVTKNIMKNSNTDYNTNPPTYYESGSSEETKTITEQ